MTMHSFALGQQVADQTGKIGVKMFMRSHASRPKHMPLGRIHRELDLGYGLLQMANSMIQCGVTLDKCSRPLAFFLKMVCRISSCRDASIDVLGSATQFCQVFMKWLRNM